MGIRYRKSINAGPLRVNLSKSGVGCSVGTKGFRFTKKSNGGTRTTTSIPGTGISYVKDSSRKKKGNTMESDNTIEQFNQTPNNQNNYDKPEDGQNVTLTEVLLAWFLGCFGAHKFYKKKIGIGILYLLTFGILTIGWFGDAILLTIQYNARRQGKVTTKKHKYAAYIAAALCVLIMGSCASNGVSEPPATEPLDTTTPVTETATEATTVPTESETIAPTTTPSTTETTEVPTTVTEPIVEDTHTPTEPEEIASSETTSTEPKEEMVWIPTNGGTKYHSNPSCSNMEDPRQVTLSEAQEMRFEPCKRCH